MQWEYFDRMVLFKGTEQGLMSGLSEWINDAGADGWELVGATPLVAPFKAPLTEDPDPEFAMSAATIGVHLIFKRPKTAAANTDAAKAEA